MSWNRYSRRSSVGSHQRSFLAIINTTVWTSVDIFARTLLAVATCGYSEFLGSGTESPLGHRSTREPKEPGHQVAPLINLSLQTGRQRGLLSG